MSKIYVIHENQTWTDPLLQQLAAQSLPFEDWFLDEGSFEIGSTPPEGVFYNRMSASSHTRDHRYAPEYTAGVLSWLESFGRRVINPVRALNLEVSKIAQYAALNTHGIRTPRTIAAVGRDENHHRSEIVHWPLCHQAQSRGPGPWCRLVSER